MTLKAEILPNDRKYYGTRIEITNTETGASAEISVWINYLGDGTPSEREYDYKDDEGRFTIIDDEDDQHTYEFEICDDHYESAVAYKVSQKIVEALNGMEI